MGRSPCGSSSKDKKVPNKGAWSFQEDQILINYIKAHGEGKWRLVAQRAGLNRCGNSCRLRWLNYLRPDIKRGSISKDEEDLIIRLHKLLGNRYISIKTRRIFIMRWALIAGRLPGRTDNEIKNYWNTYLVKKFQGETLPKSEETNQHAEANNQPQEIQTDVAEQENVWLNDKDMGDLVKETPSSTSSSRNELGFEDNINDHTFDLLTEFNVEDNIFTFNELAMNFSEFQSYDINKLGLDIGNNSLSSSSSSECPFWDNQVARWLLGDEEMKFDDCDAGGNNLKMELQKVASFLELENHEWTL